MFKQTLQPGESRDYSQAGRIVRIDAGSKVRVQTDRGEVQDVFERETVEFQAFTRITLTNIGDQAEVIQARAGTARIIASDDGASVQVVNDVGIDDETPVRTEIVDMPIVSVSATVNKSNWVNSFDDLVWTGSSRKAIASASDAHVEIMLKNPSWSDGPIRIGGSGVSATSGFALEPGESVICTCEGSLYGWADDGAVLTRSILRIV